MKQKIILTIIISIIFLQTNAQRAGIYIGGGFNSSSYSSTPLLNSILDEYNTTRPWLSKTMDTKMNPMTGLCFNSGIVLGKIFMEFDWVGRNKETYAEGIAPSSGLMGRRDLKIRANTFNSGIGLMVIPYLGLGLSADFGTVTCFTRTYDNGTTPPDYTKVFFSDLTAGVSFFAQVMIPISKSGFSHFVIKPYYQLMIIRSDYGSLHDDLVGSNVFYTAPDGDLRSNFGFEIKIQLGFGSE